MRERLSLITVLVGIMLTGSAWALPNTANGLTRDGKVMVGTPQITKISLEQEIGVSINAIKMNRITMFVADTGNVHATDLTGVASPIKKEPEGATE